MPYNYNINSPPQSGSGFAGAVPGPIDLPNPYQDVARHLPSLGPLNNAAGSDVLSQLHGQLSPETLARIQDASASFGISSGMPGSGLQRNRTARDLGLATEDLQNQGLKNYGNLLGTVSKTQTIDPGLEADIASRNATFAAAPNPAAATSHAEDLFNSYLNSMGRGNQPWYGNRFGGGATLAGGGGGGFSNSFGGLGSRPGGDTGGGGFYPPAVAGGALGTPAPGPQSTNDWLMRTFGNTRPGIGLGGGDPSGNVGFGDPGSMDADLGQFLYDQAGAGITGGQM
jgi:hypothetical protein